MRKQRTREHIIEDLGINHIERQVLHAGYTFYRYTTGDYGYDASFTTFNENGEIENLQMNIQLKSTDFIKQITQCWNAQAIIILPYAPDDAPVLKAYFANYSIQLYYQGIIDDMQDMAKMIDQNRMAVEKQQHAA